MSETPRWPKVNPKQSFPEQELDILKYWTEEKIFEESVAREPKNGEFVFYDGPPFATGLPHYGHILQSVIKDLVPRYQTMRGHRVARKWGWDCHGLPVENLIEKELNLADKKALEAYGIDRFNEACRASVLRYADEWRRFIPRMGRWVDMENDYKTMDPAYMSSVWWVFKSLWDKGLIYEGLKPMHICPRCVTPLSNFEVGLGYKDATDLSAIAEFRLKASHPDIEMREIANDDERKTCHAILREEIYGDAFDPAVFDGTHEATKKSWQHVFVSAGEIIGCGQVWEFEPGTFALLNFAFKKEAQQRGFGTKALDLIADFIAARGGDTIYTNAESDVATGFYTKNGFEEREWNDPWRDEHTTTLGKKIESTYFLAWTTTPWTLPGNFALAVHPEVEYVRIRASSSPAPTGNPKTNNEQKQGGLQMDSRLRGNDESLWLAKDLIAKVFGEQEIEILETKKGSELIGLAYEPLFDFFSSEKEKHPNAFTVRAADFVTTTDGTGIVHIAPAYGEDDLSLGRRDDLPLIQHVTMDGHFVPAIATSEYAFGKLPIKHGKTLNEPDKVDVEIVKWLDEHGKLFASQRERHSYPHCWRCDTALLNYATSSWFVAVEKIKEQLLANNEKINWVPGHVKAGRFGKWLEGARDWAISRNRYWGAPLSVWRCDSCEEAVCIGSIEELTTLSGQAVTDLHKHFVDPLTWGCATCAGTMHRIPEVLDCWFESGSMPYAQTAAKGDTKLPANFIAEAQDQTRGWFYTLHVLATALQDKPAFENVICSGLVLAEDGQKMSKSKKNYPDPSEIIDEFGADAMRLYLMSSPIVQGEELRFSRRGVEETLRGVLLPLWNTYYFFTTYAIADGWEPTTLPLAGGAGGGTPADGTYPTQPPLQGEELAPANKLDCWILSELNILIREMTGKLDEYKLNEAVKPLAAFLDSLTNWYVRRSRRRFWRAAKSGDVLRSSQSEEGKSDSDTDKQQAYATLLHVLTTVSKLLAPVSPFIAETVYRGLTNDRSVHLEEWPTVDETRIDEGLSEEFKVAQEIVSVGLRLRSSKQIKTRQPLARAVIGLPFTEHGKDLTDFVERQKEVIKEELNVKNIEFVSLDKLGTWDVKIKFPVAGPRLGAKIKVLQNELAKGNWQQTQGGIVVLDEVLKPEECDPKIIPQVGLDEHFILEAAIQNSVIVALDTTITPELEREGRARDLIRVVQELRKKANFDVSDRIELAIRGADDILADEALKTYITTETLATIVDVITTPDASDEVDGVHVAVRRV